MEEKVEIWQRFKEGDDRALSKIYALYVHQLYSYGLKIVNNPHLVKDCIQEVFVQLIEKRHTLHISNTTHLYLFKAIRNKLYEELRTSSRRNEILESLTVELRKSETSREQSMIVAEDQERMRALVKKAISRLTKHQQEVIFLKYTRCLENTEIAEILDVDVASVRTMLYRTLKKIRELL